MSNYVIIHYGPIENLDGITYRIQKIRGLRDCLQLHGFRVDIRPLNAFDVCIVELCGYSVFRCRVSNFGFNTYWTRDELCQKALDAVLGAQKQLLRADTYHWLYWLIGNAILDTDKFEPKLYYVDDISDVHSINSVSGAEKEYSIQLEDNQKDMSDISLLLNKHAMESKRSLAKDQNFFENNNSIDDRINLSASCGPKISSMGALDTTIIAPLEESGKQIIESQYLNRSLEQMVEKIVTNVDQKNSNSTVKVDHTSKNNLTEQKFVSDKSDVAHILKQQLHSQLNLDNDSNLIDDDYLFLEVDSIANLKCKSLEWASDFADKCASQLLMQKFITPNLRPNKSTSNLDDKDGQEIAIVKNEDVMDSSKKSNNIGNLFDALNESPEEKFVALQKHGYRVDFVPVLLRDYCMLEICGHEVFRCNVQNLKFNTFVERDKVAQRAVQAVLDATERCLRARSFLWSREVLEHEIFVRSEYAPRDYFAQDPDIEPLDNLKKQLEFIINSSDDDSSGCDSRGVNLSITAIDEEEGDDGDIDDASDALPSIASLDTPPLHPTPVEANVMHTVDVYESVEDIGLGECECYRIVNKIDDSKAVE